MVQNNRKSTVYENSLLLKMMHLHLLNSKMDKPAKQWNAMQALSNQPVLEVFMPELKFTAAVAKPCIKCGVFERDARGQCKPCARVANFAWRAKNKDRVKATGVVWRAANLARSQEKSKAWRLANPDAVKARNSAWRTANPEIHKACTAAWRAANPEVVKAKRAARYTANKEQSAVQSAAWNAAHPEVLKARTAAWAAANPEAKLIHGHNYRARVRAVGGSLSTGLAAKLFKLQQGKCPCCNQPLGDNYHMDHIIPLALGGSNTDGNIQLLRSKCNQQKYNKHPVAFMQARGFLL